VKARGSPEAVVTSESLTSLYGTEVSVTETTLCDCGMSARVCVPLVRNGNNGKGP